MSKFDKIFKKTFVCILGMQIAFATSAHANPVLALNSSISASLMILLNPNLCIAYSYDLNGNRISRSDVIYGAPGATWGSAIYACFDWTSP